MNEKIRKIQLAIGKLQKDKKGYNYKYFDINQLVEKLLPFLDKEGITVTQPLTHVDGRPAIMTRLSLSEGVTYEVNKSGPIKKTIGNRPNDDLTEIRKGVYSEDYEYVIPLPDLDDPQKMGSVITYYRRYSLVSLFLLQAADDDGAKAKDFKKVMSKDNSDVPF